MNNIGNREIFAKNLKFYIERSGKSQKNPPKDLTNLFQYSIMVLIRYKRIKKKGDVNMPQITLKAARVNAGYTQEQAAKALGVGKKTIWNWENGKGCPNVEKLNKICSLYKISYDNINFFAH